MKRCPDGSHQWQQTERDGFLSVMCTECNVLPLFIDEVREAERLRAEVFRLRAETATLRGVIETIVSSMAFEIRQAKNALITTSAQPAAGDNGEP